jgi:sulfatase maturation enzyme AslB (radical SAM superfamily)
MIVDALPTLPREQRFGPAAVLKHVWLELTGRCNLTCSHCYADSSPNRSLYGDMTERDWHRVVDECFREGARSIQFIGGEPMLHPHLDNLIAYARRVGFIDIEVFTNGTSLTRRRAEVIRCNGGSIAVSFYSDDASTHDRITRKAGSFRRTIAGIKNALSVGLQVRAAIVNVGQDESEIIGARNLLSNLGVVSIRVDRGRKVGRMAVLPRLGEPDFSELCGACSDARLCVTGSGAVYPCIMARSAVLGSVKSQSVAALFRGDKRAAFSRKQRAHILKSSASPGMCGPQFCSPDSGNCGPVANCGPDKP